MRYRKGISLKRIFVKRLLSSVLLSFFLCSLFSVIGCSSKQEDRIDVSASAILEAAEARCPVSGGYAHVSSDFLEFSIPDALPYVDDYGVSYSVLANDYTEIGVLHVADAQHAETVLGAVTVYLDHFRKTYEPQARQYDPSEEKKLRDAACTRYGSYVIYTVMTSEEQVQCRDAITSRLLAPNP
jgi:hypothetical protein